MHAHCECWCWLVQVLAHLDDEGRQKKLARVAMDTLADMDFGQHWLLDFTQDVLLSYACSEDEVVRKSAALAAWKVTERQWAVLRCAPASHAISGWPACMPVSPAGTHIRMCWDLPSRCTRYQC